MNNHGRYMPVTHHRAVWIDRYRTARFCYFNFPFVIGMHTSELDYYQLVRLTEIGQHDDRRR